MAELRTFADFCAGIGGFRWALEAEGCSCVYTAEVDPDCVATYNHWFGEAVDTVDITKISPEQLPDFDILCAGFPCQPFSLAGKKLGLTDERSQVLNSLLKIIHVKQPQVVILENVENFLRFGNGSLHAATGQALENAGFSVFSGVLDASRFGVPQQRKRLFIVAFRQSLQVDNFAFPTGSITQTTLRPFIATNDKSIPISDKWQQYIDYYTGRKSMAELNFEPPKTRIRLERADPNVDLDDCIFQMRSSGIRAISLDRPFPTFAVSVSGGGAMIPVYSKERRHLSLLEMKRVMGFPDPLQFPVSRTAAVKQLANAVAPPVVRSLFASIKRTLSARDEVLGQKYLPL